MNNVVNNKQQLIDKAIDDLGGDITKAGMFGWEGHTHLKQADGYSHVYVLCHKNSFSVTEGLCFCTIEEFEQRKKEREMEQTSNNTYWYDYENQMAMKVPDQGTKCFVILYKQVDNPTECEVVGFWNWKAILRVPSYSGTHYYIECDLKFIKPLDWDKLSKRKQAIAYAMELFPDWAKLEDIFGSLYDAGVLKLPEGGK